MTPTTYEEEVYQEAVRQFRYLTQGATTMARNNTQLAVNAIVPVNGQGTLSPEIASAQKLRKIGNAARSVFIEREEAIEAMECCFACGEHMILLGPPGTTKSALARYFAASMGLKFFRQVLNADVVREDMFGPIDTKALLDGRWERNWSGLATADIALIDEVGKASSQVLNLLLDAMEERLARSADIEHSLPIHSIIGASNETLDEETQAIWDRFTIRLIVKPITNPSNFIKMLGTDPEKPVNLPFQREELIALRAKASEMALSPSQAVKETIHSLWSGYSAQSTSRISDRRWKRLLRVAAGKALVNGRDAIRPDDLDVARWVIWDDRKEIEKLAKWLNELTHRGLSELIDVEKLLDELLKVRKDMDMDTAVTNARSDLLFRSNKLIILAEEQRKSASLDLLPRWNALIAKARSLGEEVLR